MKRHLVHISDLLSITTRRTVSNRGFMGIQDTLSTLAGGSIFTASCVPICIAMTPRLRELFPTIMFDSPEMQDLILALDVMSANKDVTDEFLAEWVDLVRGKAGLPEVVEVTL